MTRGVLRLVTRHDLALTGLDLHRLVTEMQASTALTPNDDRVPLIDQLGRAYERREAVFLIEGDREAVGHIGLRPLLGERRRARLGLDPDGPEFAELGGSYFVRRHRGAGWFARLRGRLLEEHAARLQQGSLLTAGITDVVPALVAMKANAASLARVGVSLSYRAYDATTDRTLDLLTPLLMLRDRRLRAANAPASYAALLAASFRPAPPELVARVDGFLTGPSASLFPIDAPRAGDDVARLGALITVVSDRSLAERIAAELRTRFGTSESFLDALRDDLRRDVDDR